MVSQQEQNPLDQTPTPEAAEPAGEGVVSPGAPGPAAFWRAMLYLLIPLVGMGCLTLSANDLTVAILTSGMTMAAFWIGFSLLNPRWVGLELLGLLLAGVALTGYLTPVSPAVGSLGIAAALGWLTAAALAGAVGARLTTRYAFEDDLFFLPWLTALGVFLIVLALGSRGGLPGVLHAVARELAADRAQFDALVKESQQSGQANALFPPEQAGWMKAHFGPAILSVFMAMWSCGLWLFGRLARRLMGGLRGHRPSLLMFRLHQRYIFLLILGLVLEIFSVLSRREELAYVAWPLLTVVAIACFFEGLGVVLFLLAVRRVAAGRRRRAFLAELLLVVFCLAFGQILGLLGLLDVWFDFRRLEKLGQQLGL